MQLGGVKIMRNKSTITLVFSVVAVVMATFIAACSPAQQTGQPTGETPGDKATEGRTGVKAAEVAQQRGGKLVTVGTGTFGNPNDPHLPATATGRTYAVPITNGIMKRDLYDPKYGITGDLAKSWEVSKDGKSYTFKLREGVKFHNVAPLNGRSSPQKMQNTAS